MGVIPRCPRQRHAQSAGYSSSFALCFPFAEYLCTVSEFVEDRSPPQNSSRFSSLFRKADVYRIRQYAESTILAYAEVRRAAYSSSTGFASQSVRWTERSRCARTSVRVCIDIWNTVNARSTYTDSFSPSSCSFRYVFEKYTRCPLRALSLTRPPFGVDLVHGWRILRHIRVACGCGVLYGLPVVVVDNHRRSRDPRLVPRDDSFFELLGDGTEYLICRTHRMPP